MWQRDLRDEDHTRGEHEIGADDGYDRCREPECPIAGCRVDEREEQTSCPCCHRPEYCMRTNGNAIQFNYIRERDGQQKVLTNNIDDTNSSDDDRDNNVT